MSVRVWLTFHADADMPVVAPVDRPVSEFAWLAIRQTPGWANAARLLLRPWR